MLSSIGWNGFRFIIVTILGFWLISTIVLKLGSVGYGIWVFLQLFTISGILGFAEFGLQGGLIRYFGEHQAKYNKNDVLKLFSSAFYIMLIIGFLSMILLFILLNATNLFVLENIEPEFNEQINNSVIIYAIGCLVNFPLLVLRSYVTAGKNFRVLAIWDISRYVFLVGGFIFILENYLKIHWLVLWDLVITIVIGISVYVWGLDRNKFRISLSLSLFDFKSIQSILNLSLYMYWSKIAGIIINHGPTFIVAWLLPIKYAGYLVIARKIPGVLKQVQGVVNTVILPHVVHLRSTEQHNKVSNILVLSSRYSVLLIMPFTITLIMYSDLILQFWVGDEYVQFAGVMRGFLLVQLLMTLFAVASSALTEEHQFRNLLPYSIGQVLVFLLISLVFVDEYGIIIFVYAILISSVLYMYKLYFTVTQFNKIHFITILSKIIVPVVTVGGSVFILLLLFRETIDIVNVFALIPVALLVYFMSMMIVLFIFSDDFETEMVTRIKNRLYG